MLNIGIYGACSYTGLELVRLLNRHPHVRIVFMTSDTFAGKKLCDVAPVPFDHMLHPHHHVPSAPIDLAFLALPSDKAALLAGPMLSKGTRVIDLSAAFRLHDPNLYERTYHRVHPAPQLLSSAVYGLPELHRNPIQQAQLVANPGCYPTSVLLALDPLARAHAIAGTVIIDAKSGVSGTGKTPAANNHFVAVNENVLPYALGNQHRHVPEMEQELQAIDPGFALIFSPHLVPVSRGILSTLYVPLQNSWDEAMVRFLLEDFYRHEPFVRMLPAGQTATMAHSQGSNVCVLSLHFIPSPRQLVLCSSIDNLIKGASGQAIQNMNLMFGLDETTALL